MIGELFILQPEQHGFLGMEWFATKCGLMESFVVLSLSFSFVSGQALSFQTNKKINYFTVDQTEGSAPQLQINKLVNLRVSVW